MMRLGKTSAYHISRPRFTRIILGIGFSLAIISGGYLGQYGVEFQTLAFLGIAFFGIFAFATRRVELGLALWVLLFVLGYRAIYLTPNLRLHPLTIFIFVLFIKVLIDIRFSERRVQFFLPAQIWLFSAFWVIGIARGISIGVPWDIMANNIINFIILFPIFVVVQYSLRNGAGAWRIVVLAFWSAGTLIAFLGIIETWWPGFQAILPGLSTGNRSFLAGIEGFQRSTFAFFGSPAAVFICALTLPLTLPVIGLASQASKVLAVAGFLLQLLAVYLAGYRSVWIISAVGLLVAVWLHSGSIKATIAATVVGILFVTFAPLPAKARLGTIFETIQSGTPADSSLQKRESRTQNALEIALQEPLGMGWGASGWVHNDFAQIGADLGLFAGLLFVEWYLATLLKSFRRVTAHRELLIGLVGSYIVAGCLLLTQGVEVLTQLIAPVWFVWAVLHVYLHNNESVGEKL